MVALSYYEIISLTSLVFMTVFACGLIRSRRSYRKLLHEHRNTVEACRTLESECEHLRDQLDRQREFAEDLSEAAAASTVQPARFDKGHAVSSGRPPERYQYVKRLVAGGMNPEAIAELLAISSHEAEQLVSLARIAES